MKAYRRSRWIEPLILYLGIRWRWLLSLTPRQLYPLALNLGTHWIGCWVGLRASLDYLAREKSLIHVGYPLQNCSVCFVHCVDSRPGRLFYAMYLFWSLDNRKCIAGLWDGYEWTENQLYQIPGTASMKSANEWQNSVKWTLSWWLNMWKICTL